MERNLLFISLAFLLMLLSLTASPVIPFAAEKLKMGTAIKLAPAYYLPILAAEERGIWKKNGLDAEWMPFQAASLLHQAIVTGDIKIGLDTATSTLTASGRGVPVVIVSDLQHTEGVGVWVPAGSKLNRPEDLKGVKVGVPRLGALSHTQGLLIARRLGIEKNVRFVALGGVGEMIAALRTKAVDAIVSHIFPLANLAVNGQFRKLLSLEDHLPKKWAAHIVFAEKKFAETDRETTGKVVKSVLQGVQFIRQDRAWAVREMMSVSKYTDRTANYIYEILKFTPDGKIDADALKNIRVFLIEWGIVSRDKIPPVDELYTNEFVS